MGESLRCQLSWDVSDSHWCLTYLLPNKKKEKEEINLSHIKQKLFMCIQFTKNEIRTWDKYH